MNIREMVDDIAGDLRPQVKAIEESVPTTKNHYDRYMNILSLLGRSNDGQVLIVAMALIKAGANSNGVIAALRIVSPAAMEKMQDAMKLAG